MNKTRIEIILEKIEQVEKKWNRFKNPEKLLFTLKRLFYLESRRDIEIICVNL